MKNYTKLVLVTSALWAGASNAAPLQNGSFSSGNFTGWTTVGTTEVINCTDDMRSMAGCLPDSDPFQAFLGTSATLSLYGLGFDPPVPAMNLATNLGTMLGALNALRQPGDEGNVVYGSAITQTFDVNAGDKVTFQWNFLSDEQSNPMGNDLAFVLIDDTPQLLGNSFTPSGPTTSPFLMETGFQSETFSFPTAGTHRIAFGVMDVNDALGASGLLIDNVQVVPVPEAHTWVLMAAGLGAMSIWMRRKSAKEGMAA